MDLQTTYMGMQLKNPLIVSASPLSEHIDNIRRMEDAGAGAVVLFSLFEEQIRQEAFELEEKLSRDNAAGPNPATSLNEPFTFPPEKYLNLISNASSVIDIPIIGSLNGYSDDGWTEYARMIEQAGADGLELNIHYTPADIRMSGSEVEAKYVYVLESVKAAVRIPVAMKLSPFFSSIAHMAWQLDQAGADALVLFNRLYQSDIRLDTQEADARMPLSTPHEIRLPLMWTAILHGQIRADLAGARGVHGAEEALKYLLSGADAVMMASTLIQNGIEHLDTILKDMTEWLESKSYTSIRQIKGRLSHRSSDESEFIARTHFIRILKEFNVAPAHSDYYRDAAST